jgi:hypothetical protein
VDARSRARLAVARNVLRALRHRDFRSELGETTASGEHVVVPALPDDTMGALFDQLRSADGPIYVAISDGDDIVVLSMAQARPPKHAAPTRDDCPIHRDTQLTMIVDYLRMIHGPLTCYEASPGVMLELVDERPPAPV